jgi:hypothetical protein
MPLVMVTGANWQFVTIFKGVVTLGVSDYSVDSPNTMLAI